MTAPITPELKPCECGHGYGQHWGYFITKSPCRATTDGEEPCGCQEYKETK